MRWILVLGAAVLALASGAACSSAESTGTGGTTTTGPKACIAVTLQGGCLACTQKYCASVAKSCFGDGWDTAPMVSGAPCSDYLNCAKGAGDCASQSCQSKIGETCERCAEETFGNCLSAHCEVECS